MFPWVTLLTLTVSVACKGVGTEVGEDMSSSLRPSTSSEPDDRNDEQAESELKFGNFSLQLSEILVSDDGYFTCSVEVNSGYSYVNVSVKVNTEDCFSPGTITLISLIGIGLFFLKKRKKNKKNQTPNNGRDLKKNNKRGEEIHMFACRIVQLKMCKIKKESCDILWSVLQSENCLKILDLSNNDLQDLEVKELCVGLRNKLCKLETLRLAGCSLRGKTFELSSALQENSSLKELDLSNNDLQDSDVKELCEGLKSSLCKLETLRLTGYELSKSSCEALEFILNSAQYSLKELKLSDNDLQESGLGKQGSESTE